MTLTAGTASTRAVLAGVRSLLLAVLLVMLGNGMLRTLLGIRADALGFSTTTIGIVMAGYYAGFLVGSWVVPRLVSQVGHVRVYAALASLGSTATLVHLLSTSPVNWTAMRVVTGFSLSGLYIIAESWLNDRATNETRGRLMSVYMVVVMGGVAASQALLTVADTTGPLLFVLSAILLSAAVVPVAISIAPSPRVERLAPMPIRAMWKAAPVGVVGGLGQGMAIGALGGLGAVYAARVGMSVGRIALFVGVAVLGSVVLQWPIGLLSDRIPRRRALALVAGAASASCVWAATAPPGSAWIMAASFLVGGFSYPIYSLALSHINDVAPEGTSVAVSSLMVLVTGIGAIMGPLIGAAAMDRSGPTGLFWMMAFVHAGVTLFALVRVVVRRGIPVAAQKAFSNVPAWATVIANGRRNGRR